MPRPTRRSFLATSATLAAAAALSPHVQGEPAKPTKEKLSLAIIGVGGLDCQA